MTGHIVYVLLGSTVQQCLNDGNPYAAANVAGQIHEARRCIVFLPREESICGSIDGNKQECHSNRLDNTRGRQCTKVNLKVKPGHMKQREREYHQTEQKKPSRSVS